MRTSELKIARIGNSRGVRLPAATLRRYRVGATVLMEERADGIVLRPMAVRGDKLSWEDTAREMGKAGENWSEWDVASSDGLESVPWEGGKAVVAERKASYGKGPGGKRERRGGKVAS